MKRMTREDALLLLDAPPETLLAGAAQMRDQSFGRVMSYSPKVFIPLTFLCRNVCAYCTFAKAPSKTFTAYLEPDEVLEVARAGKAAGCYEALFTLGDKPELRYSAARKWLDDRGYASTTAYLIEMAKLVFKETALLPHINAGIMDATEMAELRTVSVSQGIMLETVSDRLCERGQPHYGCPDKKPAVRLEMIRKAGELNIPFTTGILIGIGETRSERIDAMFAIRDLHDQFGHIQEFIVQNFRAKEGTKMAHAAEPDLADIVWTASVARLVFGSGMSIQVPPNLNRNNIHALIGAGINDWGGISPVTPDHVNPEAGWPHIEDLAADVAACGKTLIPRLTIYPGFVQTSERWVDQSLRRQLADQADSEGYARCDVWSPGAPVEFDADATLHFAQSGGIEADIDQILYRSFNGDELSQSEIVRLFSARGHEVSTICAAADELRQSMNGDTVTYVVTRNINYTNICSYHCKFCAFSKGKVAEHLRGKPYVLDLDEIGRRALEAWNRGATEVCLQGGIHPQYTGSTYLDICRTIKASVPNIHIHAFSPLEVWHGASTLELSPKAFLVRLQDAGLASLPGTAAEILDDDVRRVICPDKIKTDEWLAVIEAAHDVGLRTTATIMFGHVDRPVNWARHLLRLRRLQQKTGGFTEFVPLPFVAMEAPIYLRDGARRGPTSREAILMHAISRLVLGPFFHNIQTSWTKMGRKGAIACLSAGCNDMGGTLMNESISRAAGASHGQELEPREMDRIISAAGRTPAQRSTLYGRPARDRVETSYRASPLIAV